MKLLLVLFSLTFASMLSAQEVGNRFEQAEQQEQTSAGLPDATTNKDGDVAYGPGGGPGGPGEPPAPIDDYLPLLAITAVGIIMYVSRRNSMLLNKNTK